MSDSRPLAVVTGASSGIGLELAAQFARNGFDLLVNAKDGTRLDAAAEDLRALGGEVRPVRADLRTYDGVEVLYAAVLATGRPVAAAALNAGVGKGGPFLDNDLGDEAAIIDLNISSSVHLAKRLLKDMVAHGQGRLLFVSSVAATMPGSFQAVYNASKSFLQSFAEALREELEDTGVTVTSVLPGPTDTDFFRRAGMEDTKIGQGPKDDPAAVARQAFEALMAGKATAVTGSVRTKAQEAANKVLPDRLKAAAHRRMAEPGSGEDGTGGSGPGTGSGPGRRDPGSGVSGPDRG
ncbi:SDR family NAD(P)-dependent oxidoreductase [Streptomyces lycii]|uniref:SDR family NAD(P)-dependent oxidoreductase n=1 Tax=Streptomyces lycii TaxID=2654337 RepID=A0ABQ7FG30_9ACTN|nr:SDR family NAD(P)-dependent oxidoreductase [Streptomyces lycii]KAF4407862.1 SDR family NAD(P)-dependent oxidoreductase [Streptomyces lycii]